MISEREITITIATTAIAATLCMPAKAKGIVLFAHGSGSSRFSSRNKHVAAILHKAAMATCLLDLFTKEEEALDAHTGQLRFDIDFLAQRLITATEWVQKNSELAALPLGYFGASTGAAAALTAETHFKGAVKAVVSRGGRPDLAQVALSIIKAPTLLIVGGNDYGVIELNQKAYDLLSCTKQLSIIPGATHLFVEKGALDSAGELAAAWFTEYLK